MADVIPLQGATVEFSDGDPTTPVYTAVTGAENITWGDGEVSQIDTTTLESTAMEYSPNVVTRTIRARLQCRPAWVTPPCVICASPSALVTSAP
jgi:hypothetical protein